MRSDVAGGLLVASFALWLPAAVLPSRVWTAPLDERLALIAEHRRAWQLVEAINASFNRPVIITAVGGKRGGGAAVTAFGREIVASFQRMEDKASAAISGVRLR